MTIKVDKTETLLSSINEGIKELNEKKQTQIDNQQKFEGAWRKAKLVSAYVMAFSIIVGIVDLRNDMSTIYDRVKTKIESVIGD